MNVKSAVLWVCFGLLSAVLSAPAIAQGRGKAELKVAAGTITVDYGRPSLKGRDMLAQLQEGVFWRMGMNQATVLETPAGLAFGATRVAKGSYSLWLQRSGEEFELVFNSQTGQWGTAHDPGKDVHKVAMTKEPIGTPVETFTIALVPAPKGGAFELRWGATQLSAAFDTVQ